MHCEFCSVGLDARLPENVALLRHVGSTPACDEQFRHLLDNLSTSWTASMSGGA